MEHQNGKKVKANNDLIDKFIQIECLKNRYLSQVTLMAGGS